MDKLTAMRTFRRVVELQSFSAAANDQRLSNGAVSKQVAELEASLGVTLLTRTTRRLSLTDAGRAYYERCACILDDIEETELALGVHQAIPRGSLKINCPMSLGLLHIAPLIPVFMRASHSFLKAKGSAPRPLRRFWNWIWRCFNGGAWPKRANSRARC